MRPSRSTRYRALALRLRQRGFTLVESMVALLVLSVGMIGIAALHGQSLNASRTAVYRTVAINLSADMIDRIRVNRLAGDAYENAPADNNCVGAAAVDCSPDELAEHDLLEWEGLLAQQLPGGEGAVDVDETTDPTTYTITVTWQEVGLGELNHVTNIQMPRF